MSAGASPQTPLGDLTALSQTLYLVSRGMEREERRTRRRRKTGKGEGRNWEGRGKGGSWGNSALVVGGIDIPMYSYSESWSWV